MTTLTSAKIQHLPGFLNFRHFDAHSFSRGNHASDLKHAQSFCRCVDLSDLTLSMRRVTGSPWIADFWWSVNRGLPGVGPGQRSRFLVLTKMSEASGGRECSRYTSYPFAIHAFDRFSYFFFLRRNIAMVKCTLALIDRLTFRFLFMAKKW